MSKEIKTDFLKKDLEELENKLTEVSAGIKEMNNISWSERPDVSAQSFINETV